MVYVYLIIWCFINIWGHRIGESYNFAILQQIETLYIVLGWRYVSTILNKKQLGFLTGGFLIYYLWIVISDQLLESVTNYFVNFESLLFCVIISIGIMLKEK